jgi:hypothetical protein
VMPSIGGRHASGFLRCSSTQPEAKVTHRLILDCLVPHQPRKHSILRPSTQQRRAVTSHPANTIPGPSHPTAACHLPRWSRTAGHLRARHMISGKAPSDLQGFP